MLGEKLLHMVPHFLREDVTGFGFNKGRKVFSCSGFSVGLGDGFQAGAGFLDGRAAIGFA